MAENVTAEEEALRRGLIQQEKQINDIFAQLEIRKQDLQQNRLGQDEEPHASSEPLTYLSKYEKFRVERVKKNYEDAWPMFKWLQLPFCKRMVFDELRFSIAANICLALGFFTLNRKGNRIMEFNVKNVAKVYTGITLLTTSAIVAYNIMFEPYCDINSYHYNQSLSNKKLAKLLITEYNTYENTKPKIKPEK